MSIPLMLPTGATVTIPAAKSRPRTGATQVKVAPLVTKKKRKKDPQKEGLFPPKIEGIVGKATKHMGKKRRNEDQTGTARSTQPYFETRCTPSPASCNLVRILSICLSRFF